MFPVMPKSPADLVPLPTITGPKLKPFDFGDDDSIEFLESLVPNDFAAASCVVVSARIGGRVYALKLFKFKGLYDMEFTDDDAEVTYGLFDHFHCECRAFGRLQEANREDLAVKCHGYFFLKEEYEKVLGEKFGFTARTWDEHGVKHPLWPNDVEWKASEGSRSDVTQKDGQYRPIRVIVKDYLSGNSDLQPRLIKRMHRQLRQIHELGIVMNDIKDDAYIDGVLVDFSHAHTSPHEDINPGFSYGRTSRLLWDRCTIDYNMFDDMIDNWNEKHGTEKWWIWDRFFVHNYAYCRKLRPRRQPHAWYVLRADPRLYDWREKKRTITRKQNWVWRKKKEDELWAKVLEQRGPDSDPYARYFPMEG